MQMKKRMLGQVYPETLISTAGYDELAIFASGLIFARCGSISLFCVS